MNYSSMIEEKKLKKVFIVATLLSTLVGTFGASMSLLDKIQEKRRNKKQGKIDGVQDREIQDIKKKLDRLANAGADGQRKDRDDGGDGEGESQLVNRKRRDVDDFMYSARRSRALIEDAYEENLRRVGQRYAIGDITTENKLQAQIISLQQTVISVLQDALLNGRNLTQVDIQKLIKAQHIARDGSLDALQEQYERQCRGHRKSFDRLQRPRLALEAAAPSQPRRLLIPASQSHSVFCDYSEHLQRTSRPLSTAFAPYATQCCPGCQVSIHVDTRDIWVFKTPGDPPRSFQMGARFVVKCHTSDGTFACVLCERFAEMDCFCASIDALVRHMGQAHSAAEFAEDPDLFELIGA